MSRNRTKTNVTENKDRALTRINDLLNSLIQSDDDHMLKRADLISYWIHTFSNYVQSEDTFDPKYLPKYKRGDVIKADFGYRCKNELGGRHYAIILDVSNAKSSGLVTVIPLTSKKENKRIHSSEVDIGNEIFTSLISSFDKQKKQYELDLSNTESESSRAKISSNFCILEKKRKEIIGMKEGSVAMIGHISTISKVRIQDPINSTTGILCGVKVSPTILSMIDSKIAELYMRKSKKQDKINI
jgi:pemK-like protein